MQQKNKNRIKELNQYYKTPKPELSKYLKLTVKEVQQLEEQETRLTISVADKLCALYKCSPEYLLKENSDYEPLSFGFKNMDCADLDCVASINRIVNNIEFLTEIDKTYSIYY